MYHAGLQDTPEVREKIREMNIESLIFLQLIKGKNTLEEISDGGSWLVGFGKRPSIEELQNRINYLIEEGHVREASEGKYYISDLITC
ncbi:MAG: hypothetical protein AABX64_02210 [Nanoarchaeota archaeon]